jgi:hypothetical protein
MIAGRGWFSLESKGGSSQGALWRADERSGSFKGLHHNYNVIRTRHQKEFKDQIPGRITLRDGKDLKKWLLRAKKK